MTHRTEITSSRPLEMMRQEEPNQKPHKHQPPEFPDCISQAERRAVPAEFVPSKPVLPELRIIKAVMEARDASQKSLNINANALDQSQEDLKGLLMERAEKLKEAAEKTQSAGTWDTLRKIGSAILGAVTAFLGIGLMATGGSTLLGGALVVSGVLSLANLAFADAGIWNWMAEIVAGEDEDKKKKIAALIPCVIGLVACGIGIATFSGLWTMPNMPHALAIAQIAANILTIGGTVGTQISQAKVSMSQAELQAIQTKLSEHSHQVDRLSNDIEQIMDEETNLNRLARTILNLSMQTRQALLA